MKIPMAQEKREMRERKDCDWSMMTNMTNQRQIKDAKSLGHDLGFLGSWQEFYLN